MNNGREVPRIVIEPTAGVGEWLELWKYRDLFRTLAERDIRLRYRQTALGVVWVILQPLAASLIFAVIFGAFARLPSEGTPYVAFVFAGLLPWGLFAGGVQRAGNSLVANSGLVTKIYFPRSIIPLASVAAVLVDFAVAAAVMLGLLFYFGIPLTWAVFAVPPLISLTLVTTTAMSLLFSSLTVYYRDFSYALPFVLQVWMFATPVVYGSGLIPGQWQVLYGLNPMVGVVDGFRWALLGGPAPLEHLVEATAVSFALLLIGATVFKRIERSFADVI